MTTKIRNRGRFVVNFSEITADPLAMAVQGLRIEQSAYMHDLATIRIRSKFIDWYSTMAPGSPVNISWGSNFEDSPSTFFGYVTHVRPYMKSDDYYRFDVIATGASRILRSTGQDVWKDKTPSEVALDIARKFKLNPIIEQYPLRRPHLTLAGCSYWEFLVELAKKIGFAVWVDGINLYFASISSMFNRGLPRAAEATAMGNSTITKPALARLAVDDFSTAAGLAADSGTFSGNQAQATYINPTTSQTSASKSAPKSATKRQKKVVSPITDILTHTVAHSKNEAQMLATGAAELGLMSVDGNLSCAGSPRIKPFHPIYLDLQNDQTSGWWITKSVVHEFPIDNQAEYMCKAVVSTDSLAPSAMDAPPTARTVNLGTAMESGKIKGRPVSARLLKNKNVPVLGKTSDQVGVYQWVAV